MTRFSPIFGLFLIQLTVLGAVGPAASADPVSWTVVSTPASGPARVIGSYANGCIGGAVALPSEGPGYQVIRLSRQRYFGHPALIAYLQDLGRRIEKERVGIALVGDLAQPRGGPMPSGHASHQTGLDVDIWFRLDLPRLPAAGRETLNEFLVADPRAMTLHRDRWTRNHAELVRLAATDRRVNRIFVNPAIKQALCDARWTDRSWLRKVRPWWGHAGHLHVRLDCPPGSPECVPQKPLPAGEGCGEELASWFPRHPPRPEPPKTTPVRREPVLPDACTALLTASR